MGLAYFSKQTSILASTGVLHAIDGGDDVEDVLAPPTLENQKRARDEEGDERTGRERKRVRDQSNEIEKRLTGDYTTSETAMAIYVPANGADSTPPKDTPRPTRIRGGLFKPRNTLGDSFHAPTTSKFVTNHTSARAVSMQSIQQLPVMSSFGANVERKGGQDRTYADGLLHDSAPAAKKRKTGHHTNMAGLSNDPVDLTKNESTAARTMGPLKKSAFPCMMLPVGGSTTATRRNKMFEDTELSRANKPTNSFQKAPRKSKVTSHLSQSSSQRSSVANHSNEESHHGADSLQYYVKTNNESQYCDIVEEGMSARRKINQVGTVPPNHTTARSPLNLGEQHDLAKRKIKCGSKSDIIASGKALEGQLPWPAQHENKSHKTHAQTQLRKSDPYLICNSETPKCEGQMRTLRTKFVPDLDPGRLKTKDRMQDDAASVPRRVSPINEDNGSADELHGGNTIEPSGRAASPRKHNGSPISLSDLPATEFKKTVKSEKPQTTRSRAQQRAQNALSGNCKIVAFYASSCVLTEGDLELRYEVDTETLDLYQNGFPQVVKGKQRVVGLGLNEVHKINYHPGCPRLQVDGSKNEVSHGKICVCFLDWAGAAWFQDAMMAITEDCVTLNPCTLDGISKRFATQAELIQQAHRLQMNRREDVELQLIKDRLSQPKPLHQDEEQIAYEAIEDRLSRAKLRTRMQGGTTAEELPQSSMNGEECTKSKYFQGRQTRRSTRTVNQINKERVRSPTPERWTKIHNPKRWPHAVFYPAQGLRRVTVDFDDLARLDEGEFLNDSVVSFALRQIEETMASEFKKQVHFFNSFFYTSLSTKNGKKVFNYDAVKRWTKNKDIFNVSYIVVPICLDLHWFVAIICNLDKLSRKTSGLVDDIEEPNFDSEVSSPAAQAKTIVEVEDDSVEDDVVELVQRGNGLGTMTDSAEAMNKLSLSDKSGENSRQSSVIRFHEEGLASTVRTHVVQPAAARKVGKRKKFAPTRTYNPDSPIIITLDSLGSSHTAEIRNLKDYILEEAEKKRGMAVDRGELQGVTAKGIPEQTNFCDCGLYVVGYIESFARDPKAFVDKVTSRQLDRQADFASFSPSAKRTEIRNELLKLQAMQEAEHQAEKKRKAETTKVANKLSEKEMKRAKNASAVQTQQQSVPLADKCQK